MYPDASHIPNDMAVDGTSVYWTSDAGTVMKVPLTGGTAITLASDQDGPSGIVVDDASIYWTNAGSGTVMKLARAGGPPLTLVSGQTVPGPWPSMPPASIGSLRRPGDEADTQVRQEQEPMRFCCSFLAMLTFASGCARTALLATDAAASVDASLGCRCHLPVDGLLAAGDLHGVGLADLAHGRRLQSRRSSRPRRQRDGRQYRQRSPQPG